MLNNHLLNIITQIMSYSPVMGVSDNPLQKSFDWGRRLQSIEISNPVSDTKVIAPGESLTLFDGSRVNPLDLTSVLDLKPLVLSDSIYRLTVTAGSSGFRTPRAITGVVDCTVTVNNNALAVFDFGAAALTGVVVGDVLRIKGQVVYDDPPYKFNPINAGLWKIVSVSGSKVSCVRPTGEAFAAVNDPAVNVASDVQIYSSAGIQKGDKIDITAGFSTVSQKTFTVSDATPTTIDFMSAEPLPEELSVAYTAGAISFYYNSKRFMYLEVDQDAIVRMDADITDGNRVRPITPGNQGLIGQLYKWGDTFKCVVVNKSVNPLNIKYFTGE